MAVDSTRREQVLSVRLVIGKSSVVLLLQQPMQVGAATKVADNALSILTVLQKRMRVGSELDHTPSLLLT